METFGKEIKKLDEAFDFGKFKSDTISDNKFKIKKELVSDEPNVSNNFNIQQKEEITNKQINDEIVIPEPIQEKIKVKSLKARAAIKKLQDLQLKKDSVVNPIFKQIQLQKQIQEIQQAVTTDDFQQQKLQDLQVTLENIPELLETEDIEEIEEILINKYESVNGTLPENVDIIEIANEIIEASEFIPDATDLDIDDFTITENVSGSGWKKNKVTINSKLASTELSQIATNVKAATSGIVLHRAQTITNIANVNKTQLRNSDYKLYSIAYNFKPLPNKTIIVNKFARFILSVPSDYNTTKKVSIFMQDSRSVFAIEINMDIDFISKLISDYYIVGFEVTKSRLKTVLKANPLSIVCNKYALTRKYLVKPLYDGDDQFDHIIITTKTGKHQWVKVHIFAIELKGLYSVSIKSKIDNDWPGGKLQQDKYFTIEELMSEEVMNKIEILFTTYDWKKHGMSDEDLDNREFYLMSKLTYKSIKKAFVYIYDLMVEKPENGILIKEVLSKIDTSKDKEINPEYAAEIIIGKTDFIDYFILSMSAVQIKGGNSRVSTITGENYHSREYMFTLVYSINDKKYTLQDKSFDVILEKSNFLTKNPTQ